MMNAEEVPVSPSPVFAGARVVAEGKAKAFLPYPELGKSLEHVPIHVRPELHYYVSRMGFLPHTLKLYLHTPWIAEPLFRLNNAIMRDERSTFSEEFLYRLAIIASRDNNCTYCTAHHARTLELRFGHAAGQVEGVLRMDQPADEREAVAWEFVHQSSLDPEGVTEDLRQRLAAKFSPPEVVTIVLLMGFWKMYNTMHTAMGVPLEDPVADYARFVEVAAQQP